MMEDVSWYYCFFWVLYIVMVNFAMMRVIAALFLKQTMMVANLDAERVAYEKMKEKDHFAAKLREIFSMADASGDGVISKHEFADMIADSAIVHLFESMELEVYEVTMLFN